MTRGALVRATVNAARRYVVVAGEDVQAVVALARVRYRTLGSGAVVIELDDLGDLEAACVILHRPVRIQSKRAAS